jgi:hypothetical protein
MAPLLLLLCLLPCLLNAVFYRCGSVTLEDLSTLHSAIAHLSTYMFMLALMAPLLPCLLHAFSGVAASPCKICPRCCGPSRGCPCSLPLIFSVS